MRPRYPPHLKTFDYVGLYRYFLTFCTHDRARLFITKPAVDLVLEQILRVSEAESLAVIAYCFMPDHLHLLVEAQSATSNCLRFITRAKQFSGYHYSKQFGQPLWQRYGFERTLRNDESTLAVARYILQNPVRAQLVVSAADYPFSGSKTYSVAKLLEATAESADAIHSYETSG
jgi:putative transposase